MTIIDLPGKPLFPIQLRRGGPQRVNEYTVFGPIREMTATDVCVCVATHTHTHRRSTVGMLPLIGAGPYSALTSPDRAKHKNLRHFT